MSQGWRDTMRRVRVVDVPCFEIEITRNDLDRFRQTDCFGTLRSQYVPSESYV